MLSRLKQEWKQSPVLMVTVLVLLLLIVGGVFIFYQVLCSIPGIYREGSGSSLGMIQTEQLAYDVKAKASEAVNFSAPDSAEKKIDLKIIKTAFIRFQVKDYQKSRSLIEDIIKHNDGYLASENQRSETDRIENTIVIRVPAVNLDRLMEALQGQAAYLDYKCIEARDVTEEFVDTEARLKAKREVEQRYLAVLKQAASVKDILEVESRLGKIREEIEATEGRLRYLNNQIDYSTITLHIYQPLHRLPRIKSGFVGRLSKALVNGWNGLLGFIVGLINIWPLLLTVAAGWTGYRFWRKKKA